VIKELTHTTIQDEAASVGYRPSSHYSRRQRT